MNEKVTAPLKLKSICSLKIKHLFGILTLCIIACGILFVLLNFLWIKQYCMGGSSSRTMSTPPVVLSASAKHTATVIFLHGLGDTGHGWSQAFNQIKQKHIKYVFPTADTMPVTLNMGMRMPSWFDIKGLDPGSDEDEAGIRKASEVLQNLIGVEEKCGIARDRIVVGGFSQGGAVALYSALTQAKPKLGGILGLSTWLPLHTQFPACVKSNRDTPILQCHGEADPLVRLDFGRLTAVALSNINSNSKFKTYPGMQHSSCDQEIKDVEDFINEVLPAM